LRGWGGSAKRRRLSSFIQREAFVGCLFHETKKSSFEDFLIHNFWGHQDVEWVAQDAIGLSGGMLIIWNSATFKFLNSFSGFGFLGIKVEREGDVLFIVNIYSPCHISGKIKLWEELLSFKQQSAEWE
jgi:hypothetical protein